MSERTGMGMHKDVLESLSSEQANLVSLLMRQRSRKSQKIQPYRRNSKAGALRLPTSRAQRRLWLIDQLGGSAPYYIAVVLRLRGRLNESALRVALDRIVQRHEILRTVLVDVDGTPWQEIAPSGKLILDRLDLQASDEAERDAQIRLARLEERQTSFDLQTGPLLRARLVRAHADEHLLLITMHHIVADGWSLGVLFDELAVQYRACLKGEGDPLEPLPIQYADYAQWQAEQLPSFIDAHMSYWRERLASAEPELALPADRPRPATQSYRGEILKIELGEELTAKLRRLASKHDVTLFMVLCAGWAILLSRLSGQRDVSIGSPIANRQRPELERLIGFFVNTLVLRFDVRSEQPLGDFLREVKEITLEAYDHQDLPFEQLVEVLQPQRSLSRHPIFQVMLVLQNAPRRELELEGLVATMDEEEYESSMFDLLLALKEDDHEVTGTLSFATDLFERATIERWIDCFIRLLGEMVDNDGADVGSLSILPAEQCQQVLYSFNATVAEVSDHRLIHELFEEQAARTPNRVAVNHGGSQVSYRELNEQGDRLAQYLKALGVNVGEVVGICAPRSPQMVAGLLGILKAGGAYLPLDPNYPRERLEHMLTDAAPRFVLTSAELRSLLPADQETQVSLDEALIADHPGGQMATTGSRQASDSPLYVIYTSGSTGLPKGTVMPHRAMVNLLEWHRRALCIHEGERVLQFAALSFDVAFQEIFSTLCRGGELVLIDEWTRRDAAALAEFLIEKNINMVFVPPMMLHSLAEQFAATGLVPTALTDVIAAGEQLLITSKVRQLFEKLPGGRLHNHYGPTETHVVTALTLDGPPHEWPHNPTIGSPISNTQIYVLDERGRPMPVGVYGEIHIGGANVALGYHKQPELTKQRFRDNPFVFAPHARMYRTGDWGRWLPTGAIEYLGRRDDQVKIRGYRIELGEIESQLVRYPPVQEAAVVVREDAPGVKRLIAYITVRTTTHPGPDELRAHLRTVLPEYMLPHAFVVLPQLPMTPSGKLNRRALPPPPETAYANEEYVPPQGPTEEAIATIWRDLLKLERVGRHDHFFDLGGHSLLATRVVSRIRTLLGIEVPLKLLFESPTIEQLSARLDALTKLPIASGEVESQVITRREKKAALIPLSFAQERLWFLEQLDLAGAAYNVSITLRLAGQLVDAALERSLIELVRRHESLRTRFEVAEGVPRQVVEPAAGLELQRLDVSVALDGKVPAQRLREAIQSIHFQRFDLRAVPVRAALIRVHDREHVLVLTMHHAVCDGWSLGVLLNELHCLYVAFVADQPSPLAAPVLQYADFALWQREPQREQALLDQLKYWQDQLRGMPPELDLPRDRARPDVESFRGAGEKFELTPKLVSALRDLGRQAGATPFMVLVAAFQLLLSRLTRQQDIVIGTPIAGRRYRELEGLIGPFINTLVLRVEVTGSLTFRELLARVKDVTLAAYAHQDLPFELLVKELRPERHLSRQPLVQVMLALQNYPDERVNWPGLEVSRLASEQLTTHVDLTLHLHEQTDGGIGGLCVYATDLFDAGTVKRLLGCFHMLLEGAVSAPNLPVGRLQMLDDAQMSQIITDWNRTQTPFPENRCVQDLIADQVARAPNAIAIECDDDALTYAELDAAASRLASRLTALGLSTNAVVGVCLKRSLEMVVGLLAVMKAGGAYVALSNELPIQRIALILRDAGAGILITDLSLGARVRELTGVQLVPPKDTEALIASPHESAGIAVPSARDLAYVNYTSGSTGVPKGVLIEHRSVCNLINWHSKRFGVTPGTRVSQTASVMFDASSFEIWPALASGATLVICRDPARCTAGELAAWLAAKGVNVAFLTTPIAEQLMAEGYAESLPNLRYLLVGGDVLKISPPVQASYQLVNNYGPTETTVVATSIDIDAQECALPPIGKPIDNTTVYVLDDWQQPVPIGVRGELYIGGVGVARGYLNQPALTQQRFIADPFGAPGGRLYRTGDLVRWRSNGVLEFLGRNDDQVKIRGFRIELGEVEAVLSKLPAVQQATIILREDSPGEKRLVAYLKMRDDQTLTAEQFREHLVAVLPHYMVPSAFVVLNSLPLTRNGKIDRAALPNPGADAYARQQFEAPDGLTEQALAEIWQELLQVERLGRHDNFFELGGHSLQGMKLIAKIWDRLAVRLPAVAIFQYPTIRQMAEAVEMLQASQPDALVDATEEYEQGVL